MNIEFWLPQHLYVDLLEEVHPNVKIQKILLTGNFISVSWRSCSFVKGIKIEIFIRTYFMILNFDFRFPNKDRIFLK